MEDLPGDVLIFMPGMLLRVWSNSAQENLYAFPSYVISQRHMHPPFAPPPSLTGQEDCEQVVQLLEQEATRLRRSNLKLRLMPVPLYAGLPGNHQLQVFEAPPRGYRKVVVSTNIAETSVTIQGIVYVIDSMFAKQKLFNPLTGLEGLLTAPISKASAVQRAGRAGRVHPGHCFRLCTEADYDALQEATVCVFGGQCCVPSGASCTQCTHRVCALPLQRYLKCSAVISRLCCCSSRHWVWTMSCALNGLHPHQQRQ